MTVTPVSRHARVVKGQAYDALVSGTEFITIDIETTPVPPALVKKGVTRVTAGAATAPAHPVHRPVSIGCVVTKNGVDVSAWHWLIHPGIGIDPSSTRHHHVTDAMVAREPGAQVVLAGLVGALMQYPNALIVCHNASFDIGTLRDEADRVGVTLPTRRILDTMLIPARLGLKADGPQPTLDKLTRRYGVSVVKDKEHLARQHALATKEVLLWLLAEAAAQGITSWPAFLRKVRPADTITIKASYPTFAKSPKAKEVPLTHYQGAHDHHLPRGATKADLDEWTAEATECVRLRCEFLPEKVHRELGHSVMLRDLLNGMFEEVPNAPGEMGTLLAGMEPILAQLDFTQVRKWYFARQKRIQEAPRCTQASACPDCVAGRPCPIDTIHQVLAERAVAYPDGATLTSKRARDDFYNGNLTKIATWKRAHHERFIGHIMWLVVMAFYTENDTVGARKALEACCRYLTYEGSPLLALEVARDWFARHARTDADIEAMVKAVLANANTDPGFAELDAWFTYTFLPASKAKPLQVRARVPANQLKRRPAAIEIRPTALTYDYRYRVHIRP